MRATIKTVAMIAMLMVLPLHGQAQDLYTAEAPVGDEASETRNAKLSELLAEVLVRVSGNTAIGGQPAAREVLDAAPSLVQQFRYRTVGEGERLQRVLWARFDQAAVDRMMRERGLPVWGQRPDVLLWLGTERRGQRVLFNLESAPEARDAALARAAQRGMPLQLPLMDLEDQSALQPADLWADFVPGIRTASARYLSDVVLVGRLSARADGTWQGSWSLLLGDERQTFLTSAMPLDKGLAFAIDQAQNLLAARFAPMPGAGGIEGTLVRFSGIRDLADYGRLMAMLAALEPVSRVALRHADGDSLIIEFGLRGSSDDLARALENSGELMAEPAGRLAMPAQTGEATAPSAGFQTEVGLAYRLLN
jgi:hypothetical protein